MTKEAIDFLDEFKKQAVKYLIGYFFVSLSLFVGFYIDTKIEIGKLHDNVLILKESQQANANQISKILEMHLNK